MLSYLMSYMAGMLAEVDQTSFHFGGLGQMTVTSPPSIATIGSLSFSAIKSSFSFRSETRIYTQAIAI